MRTIRPVVEVLENGWAWQRSAWEGTGKVNVERLMKW